MVFNPIFLNTTKYHRTQNNRGFMHPLTDFSRKFIAFSKEASPVIDMGCAFGAVSVAMLEAGAQTVIACDMAQSHLDFLKSHVPEYKQNHLILRQGQLPDGFDFMENSIGGIYISHVLEYLNGEEVEKSLHHFYQWLKPNGKLFIKCYSIFIKELMNKKFLTEYQNRLNLNISWPGYMDDYEEYSLLEDEANAQASNKSAFPSSLHLFDLSILTSALLRAGFKMEFASYLDGKANHAPIDALFDGREYIGIIAMK